MRRRNCCLILVEILILFDINSSSRVPITCDSPIYCDGPLLHTIQMSRYFPDSKSFVDMPTRMGLDQVLANFNNIKNTSDREEIGKFLAENFYPAGTDTIKVLPLDWEPTPKYINKINDLNLVRFAKDLHSRWKDLMRKFDKNQTCDNCKTSAIITKHPFVVPGGRFIEYYYWDSYWIIKGLLVSGMHQTARDMIQNFLDIVAEIGFVPNGARIYYLNRSQPPLLIHMIDEYFERTNDIEFLRSAIDIVDKEYSFWMSQKAFDFPKNGKIYRLNKYDVKTNVPRPESYREDYENGNLSPNKTAYYMSVASAAESGWDFSSRWFVDPLDIKTIAINDIIPVDLNAIMHKNELLLNKFFTVLKNDQKANFYLDAMKQRGEAINAVLWNETKGTWGDFNIRKNSIHNDFLYITDLAPLWSGVKAPKNVDSILEDYRDVIMKHISGIPASSIPSDQQWDFPNVWAPYHDWIVDYMVENNKSDTGFDIAQRFVRTVYCGWKKTSYIFEKYNADKIGEYGAGGEYVVQEGFGWTNGVVIIFMDLFGDRLNSNVECNFSLSVYRNSYFASFVSIPVFYIIYFNFI